jgi:hypothetical protein
LTTDKIGNTLNPVAEASYDFHAMLKQLRSGALADELCAMRSRMEKKLGDACIGGYEMREVAERISPKKPPQAIPAAPIDPLRKYKPHEVAAILNCSYRTALRRMTRMKGKMDLGEPGKQFQRRKRMLRISGKSLLDYLRNKQK